jgi:hypothetical protein
MRIAITHVHMVVGNGSTIDDGLVVVDTAGTDRRRVPKEVADAVKRS